MKFLHIVALVCFLIATGFYLTSWPQGAAGLGLFGVVFEIAALVALHKSHRSTVPDAVSAPTPIVQTSDLPTHRDSDEP